MFRRNYILRLIEQVVQALHQIIGLKTQWRFDEAEIVIWRTGRLVTGLRI